MNSFKFIIFSFLLCPLTSFCMEEDYGAASNCGIRNAVQARIELYKKTQNREHLNLPLTFKDLGKEPSSISYYTKNLTQISPLAALVYSNTYDATDYRQNRDLIHELLNYGVRPDTDAILEAIYEGDVTIVLLLLHRNVFQNDLNDGFRLLLDTTFPESVNIKNLLLSYGAQPNSKNCWDETILYELVGKIMDCYESMEEHIFFNGLKSNRSSKIALERTRIEKRLNGIKQLLKHNANPYIKDAHGKSCFDLINECKDAQRNPVDAKLNLKPLPTSEQTKKELDELAALLKKPVDDRIKRMTDFLHTRASETPFAIKDIAQKIAEHVYKDDGLCFNARLG